MPKIKFVHPPFYCPEKSIIPHMDKVFSGEYDVPYFDQGLTILDLGANLGAFAIWASHRWPNSQVLAYEPHPDNYIYLRRNTAIYPNITTFSHGLGKPGWRPLYNGKNNCGEATLFPNPVSDGTAVHVEIKDPFSLPHADIIKLDIEGAEGEVLIPLLEAGRTFRAIMFEWHTSELRWAIDSLLKDYILVQCLVGGNPELGTACYIHKSIKVELPE